ncbi:hypothetical protein SAMN05444673_6737 [Bacillus sp. OV166]|uniref:hypothetical protein n=1 Tax=Bacillus sp. OV166 TaxID=1882763 RepID=UPI000A2ADE95|nr:hypothetical protein [Bacillus sp. OV166]SMQ86725.1 hypothetical protein SAMN05444673_6737 [Bacillus sp. OV166]
MMTLMLKRYYMKEFERENYEKQVLEVMPELDEGVFELDDFEIRDLVENMNKNQQIAI